MSLTETRQVLICELEQTHRGRQAPAVLGVQRMFVILLQMHKGASGLNQTLEKIRVRRFGVEPKLLQDIVRFVITLFIPATEERAVKGVLRDGCRGRIDIAITQLSHQL